MVARTKSKIACFAGPAFHDGGSPPAQAQLHQRLYPDIEAMRPLLHEYRFPLLVA
jgi:hypothetical protein